MDLKVFSEIVNNFAVTGSIIAAGWWFFTTAKSKQRIQFDIETTFFKIDDEDYPLAAEIKLIFENKGFVEHKIHDLALAIYGMKNTKGKRTHRKKDDQFIFSKLILDKTRIVKKDPGYYFVRPGVAQIVTEIRKIPANISTIKVLGGFTYIKRHFNKTSDRGAFTKPYVKHNHPHTALRIFEIPDELKQ